MLIGIDITYRYILHFVHLFLCCYFYSLSEDEAKEVFKSLRQAAGIFMQAKVFFFVIIFFYYGCGFIGLHQEKTIFVKNVSSYKSLYIKR